MSFLSTFHNNVQNQKVTSSLNPKYTTRGAINLSKDRHLQCRCLCQPPILDIFYSGIQSSSSGVSQERASFLILTVKGVGTTCNINMKGKMEKFWTKFLNVIFPFSYCKANFLLNAGTPALQCLHMLEGS